MTLSGLVEKTELDTDFDALTTDISDAMADGYSDHVVWSYVHELLSGTALARRVVDFTAPDDCELRCMRLALTCSTTGRLVTFTLTQSEGDTAYLLDLAFSVSLSSINGTNYASLDCRTTTQARRIKLARGVRYRLTLTCDQATTGPEVTAALVLRMRRRRR